MQEAAVRFCEGAPIIKINEHMKLTRDERRSHLILSDPCLEISPLDRANHHVCRGILAYFLGTSIPYGRDVFCCHACHNRKCSNPKHLYWGTPKDNTIDQIENGTMDTIANRMKKKFGGAALFEQQSAAGVIGGQANKGKPKNYEMKNGFGEDRVATPRTWSSGSRKGIKMPRSWSRQKVDHLTKV